MAMSEIVKQFLDISQTRSQVSLVIKSAEISWR